MILWLDAVPLYLAVAALLLRDLRWKPLLREDSPYRLHILAQVLPQASPLLIVVDVIDDKSRHTGRGIDGLSLRALSRPEPGKGEDG